MPIFCARVSCLTLVSAWHHGPLLPRKWWSIVVQDRDDTILRLRAVVASSSQIWPRAAGSIHNMGMDQYLLIPFLGGWTSINQLFRCSPGVQGFDTLPYKSRHDSVCVSHPLLTSDFLATFARHFCTRMCQSQVFWHQDKSLNQKFPSRTTMNNCFTSFLCIWIQEATGPLRFDDFRLETTDAAC